MFAALLTTLGTHWVQSQDADVSARAVYAHASLQTKQAQGLARYGDVADRDASEAQWRSQGAPDRNGAIEAYLRGRGDLGAASDAVDSMRHTELIQGFRMLTVGVGGGLVLWLLGLWLVTVLTRR